MSVGENGDFYKSISNPDTNHTHRAFYFCIIQEGAEATETGHPLVRFVQNEVN